MIIVICYISYIIYRLTYFLSQDVKETMDLMKERSGAPDYLGILAAVMICDAWPYLLSEQEEA